MRFPLLSEALLLLLVNVVFAPSPSYALSAPLSLAGSFGLRGLGGNCLDVSYANRNPGAKVDASSCNGTPAQLFTFKNGTIQSAWGQCLEVLNESAGTLDWGACNGTPSQVWKQAGEQIIGLNGKCLDVQYGNPAPGTAVDLAGCNSTLAQNWQIIDAPTILTAAGSKCLDILNGSTNPGARLQIYECNRGENAQLFTFTSAGEIRNHAGECLDVMYGNAPGGQVQMSACNGTDSQRWTRDDRRLISSLKSVYSLTGYCLSTVQSFNPGAPEVESGLDRTPVGVAPCSGHESQQWIAADLFQNAPATLLIVTSDAFQPSFNGFVTHKQAIGIATTVVTMSTVRSTFPANDDALSLKKAIEFYYRNYGTTYVLLGGDTSQVPIRYRRVLDGGGGTQSFIFSDLYYANLYSGHMPNYGFHGAFDTWDANGDGLYNDQSWDNPLANPDNVDGFPDIAVGRIPAYSSTVLQTILTKIIAYENGPGLAGIYYGLAADACYPGYSGISDIANSIGINQPGAFAEETDKTINGQLCNTAPNGWTTDTPQWGEFQSAFDKAQWSWVVYVGHGGPAGWGYYGTYNSGQIVALSNSQLYPIVVASACQTAAFAQIPQQQPLSYRPSVYDPNASQYSQPNIGSQFLFNSNGGAIAYIGENIVQQDPQGVDFTKKLFYQYKKNGYGRLGDIWRLAQQSWFDANFTTPVFDNHFAEPRIFLGTFNLLGDPSMRLAVN
jgi:hypothetical protein